MEYNANECLSVHLRTLSAFRYPLPVSKSINESTSPADLALSNILVAALQYPEKSRTTEMLVNTQLEKNEIPSSPATEEGWVALRDSYGEFQARNERRCEKGWMDGWMDG